MPYMVDLLGRQVGNYRLVQLLGQGGFADVYLGEHVHLNVPAAIKLLRTHLLEEDVQNFRIEARTIAHLAHPNIVQVLDFGVENTMPFLVMAYAPNGTLRQRHRRGEPLPAITIISYARQVAAALHYAHGQKIIHRDIKPENMLVGRNNEILLSDFGIALPTVSARGQGWLANPGSPEQSTWDPVGTVTYMAPEQIQGKPSPASDQYALGVVIYEWISGYTPFNGSYVEIAMQKISTTPGSLRARVPDLPPDVEQVVLTALATDPQRRFRSVQAFAAALEQAYNPAVVTVIAPPLDAALIGPSGRIPLKGEVISLGRRSTNTVVLGNDKVSSRHAELRLAGKDYCLVDLESTNGTSVNGEKLAPQTLRLLKSGDTITIGDTVLTYEIRGAEEQEPHSDGSTVRAEEPEASNSSPTPARSGDGAPQQVAAYEPPSPFTPPPAPLNPPPPLPPVQSAGPDGASGAQYPAQSFYKAQSTPSLPPAQPSYGSGSISGAMHPLQPAYGVPNTPPLPPARPSSYGPGGVSGAMYPAQPAYTPNNLPPAQPVYGPGGVSGAMYPAQPISSSPGQFAFAQTDAVPFHAPAGQVSQPGFAPPLLPIQPASAPPRRSGNRVKIIVAIALVILLVGGGSIGFVLYRNAQPAPAKTLTAFCTALVGKDNATVQSELSPKFQNAVPSAIFNAFFTGTTGCTPATPIQNTASATTTLALVSPARSATDNVTLVQQSDSSWKIDDESGVSSLMQMLRSYCSALSQGNYPNAYNQLSSSLQGKLTTIQFALYFPKASTCTYSSLVMTNGGAQITLSEAGTTGPTDNNETSLVEANGGWKIDDFTNLPEKTLTSFCNDLQKGDGQNAYNLTTPHFQSAIGGFAGFTNFVSTFNGCSYNSLASVNGSLTSAMTFTLKSGGTFPLTGFLVRDTATAKWEIDNLVNFPYATLSTFCADLGNHDYQGAYNELAQETRASVSLQKFTTNYSHVTRCVSGLPTQSGSTATATLTFTLTNGAVAKQTATLIEENPDSWKILALRNN
jgi:serine/threonine protein kinase